MEILLLAKLIMIGGALGSGLEVGRQLGNEVGKRVAPGFGNALDWAIGGAERAAEAVGLVGKKAAATVAETARGLDWRTKQAADAA